MPGDVRETSARLSARGAAGLVAALLLGGFAAFLVGRDRAGTAAFAAWLLAIASMVAAFAPLPRLRRPSKDALLGLGLAFLPIAVRVLNTHRWRIHGDELITAYYTAHDDFSPAHFFAGYPQETDWVCQFPSPWFALQRAFFAVFGDGLDQVRWSEVPYAWLTAAALFFAVRRIAGRGTAVVTVLVYAFLSPSLYIETTGLHFIAGTAAFMLAFLQALRLLQDGGTWNAALAGLALAFCYLVYPSSYIALPVFALFGLVHLLRTRRAGVLAWIVVPGTGVAAILAPFVVYALTVHNYFTERSEQIWFFNHHTPEIDALSPARRIATILGENVVHAVRSIWAPGLGGSGGYWYGEQAFLEPVTAAFFLAGVACAVVLARRRAEFGLALGAFLVAFVPGAVLTVPPIGFHRLSVVYPLVAFLAALPLHVFSRWNLRPAVLKQGIVAICVALLAARNLTTFSRIASGESVPEDLYLADWVNTRYPDRALYVAAFPGYAYRKLSYFAPTRRRTPLVSNYHTESLQAFRADEKYLYLVAFPSEFRARFQKVDPDGRYIELKGLREWAIFLNPDGPRP